MRSADNASARCTVQLLERRSKSVLCHPHRPNTLMIKSSSRDGMFGCYDDTTVWTVGGCSGRFRCTGDDLETLCGLSRTSELHTCTCSKTTSADTLPGTPIAAAECFLNPYVHNQGFRGFRQPHAHDGEDLLLLPTLLAAAAQTGVSTFLEMGALDGVIGSNTLLLEKCYGWNGTLVEAQPNNFARPLRSNRRRSYKVHSAACAAGGTVEMSISAGPTAGQIGVERMCRSIRSACAQMGRAPGPQTALCGQRLGMRVADQRRVKS